MGPDSRVDAPMAVVVAEDTDREEGRQYSGGLLYDLKVPNPGPKQRVSLIGRISGDIIAMDVMSSHDGVTINNVGMHLVMTGLGDGGMLVGRRNEWGTR